MPRRAYSTTTSVFDLQRMSPMLGWVACVLQRVIHRRQVKVHFARILGFELSALQVNYHETSQLQVVEEQIDPVVLPSDVERILPADKCKPNAQLNEKLLNVPNQAGLDFSLMHVGSFSSCCARSDWGDGKVR